MTKQPKPILHARDHEHGGADPYRIAWETVTVLTKVLKADATAADALVAFDLGAGHDEVWVTTSVFFTNATYDLWVGVADRQPAQLITLWTAGYTDFAEWALITGDSDGAGTDAWATRVDPAGGGIPASDMWTQMELHYTRSGLCELYIDADLVASGTDTTDAIVRIVEVGLRPSSSPAGAAYFGEVKAGTTRGAADLFTDTFEGGTLAAWTTTTGDVSVVDDPA